MSRRKYNTEIIKQIVDGEKPFAQFGYDKKQIIRKDGEIWTDHTGKWRKKNGAIFNVNDQADSIRDLVKRKCADCGFDIDMLGTRMDEKMYVKTGMCFDCSILKDTERMINGTFQSFSEDKMLKNKLSLAKEFKKNIIETIDYLKKDDSKLEMVHSNGDITTWVGSQNEKLLKEAVIDLEKVDKLIVELEEEIKNL